MKKTPGFLQIIRAPFLSSIISPVLAGTCLAVIVSESFDPVAFLLVLITGIGLHIATNVYNDIYDTLQGTDRVNIHRNEFSGGSGIMVDHPHLQARMFRTARGGLLVAFFAAAGLTFILDPEMLPYLWGLYLLSVFFSKYYTAAPVKLASRGWGEVSVWFAFGPMAILIGAVGQGIGLHPVIVSAMPVTGLSTLSILLIGQLIDIRADTETGKMGVAARKGSGFTYRLYLLVQLLLVLNILYLGLFAVPSGRPVLLALAPYIVLFPRTWKILHNHHHDPDALKPAAGLNVRIHLLFSVLLITGLILTIFLR